MGRVEVEPILGHSVVSREQPAQIPFDTVVPIHYGTFPILAGTPGELSAALEARGLGDVRVITSEPGELVS